MGIHLVRGAAGGGDAGAAAWVAPAFDAGTFSGNNDMTWTVAEGDINDLSYHLNGKTMTVAFNLALTTVGGVLDTFLQITIPTGATAKRSIANVYQLHDDGTLGLGVVLALAGSTFISLRAAADLSWAAATTTTNVLGQLTFEIE